MQAGPASAASASSTLLVVDDEPAGLYVKRVALERAGFSVLEASTGAEALAVVAAKSPDLVILDVKLPDVDGFQVCREVKRNPRTAATMVLQVSAHYTSANDHVQGLEQGADAYMPGDISGLLLVAAVRALLRTQRAERSLRDLQTRERQRLAAEVEASARALDRTKEELRALAASLLSAQEDEARRIARDLHDDLGQQLAVLQMRLTEIRQQATESAPQLEAAIEQVVALSDNVRNISHRLHPTLIEHLGLDAALRKLCDECTEKHEMPLRYISDAPTVDIPAEVATVLYRITQEALRNIQKHAGDARTVVALWHTADELVLAIEDDGCGFDLSEVRRTSTGLGLVSLQERARLIGADVLIRSVPGQGARLEVHVPAAATAAE